LIIIHGLNKIRKFHNPVVALGVFDGVHRGHKEILKAAVLKARQIKGTSMVMTFWPHPQGQHTLYSLEHRLRLIAELGIDVAVVVNFSRHFSRIDPFVFVKGIIVEKISAQYLYAGKDFRFGRKASGCLKLLRELGKLNNFKVKGFTTVKYKSRPISSTLIRRMIRAGNLKDAADLLGRPVSILGTVARGDTLGRILGFPTANINPHHEVIPSDGIYAVKIILGKNRLKGACYIGRRPTIKEKDRKRNVEVHILNFNRNIYGRLLEIQFVKRIRPDRKFSSTLALKKQIRVDCLSANKFLS